MLKNFKISAVFYAFVVISSLFVNLYLLRDNNLIIKRDDNRIERVKTNFEVANDIYKELEVAHLMHDEVLQVKMFISSLNSRAKHAKQLRKSSASAFRSTRSSSAK